MVIKRKNETLENTREYIPNSWTFHSIFGIVSDIINNLELFASRKTNDWHLGEHFDELDR